MYYKFSIFKNLSFNFSIFISSSKYRNSTLFIIISSKHRNTYEHIGGTTPWNIISLGMKEQDFHSVRQNSQPVQS